jgi:hypothetical protein
MATMVSLVDVVDALESAADEMSSYVNAATGQVITVTHEDLRLAEQEPVPEMPDWQREAPTGASVASRPRAPAAERLYRWADRRETTRESLQS